jgi:hypothetical protein
MYTGNHCIRAVQLSDFVTACSGGGIESGDGGAFMTAGGGGGFMTGVRVWTIAGDAAGRGFMDKFGAEARFNSPRGVFVDSSGSILVIDAWNHRRKKKSHSHSMFTTQHHIKFVDSFVCLCVGVWVWVWVGVG